jgi:hypothetical protein
LIYNNNARWKLEIDIGRVYIIAAYKPVVREMKTHILLYYQHAVRLLITALIIMAAVNKVAVFDLQESLHHC